MRSFPGLIAVVEHLRIAGLVARARRKEAATLFAPLFGSGGAFGLGERAGAAVGGQERDEIRKLLRLQGEDLIAGLRRLKGAGRALALVNLYRPTEFLLMLQGRT